MPSSARRPRRVRAVALAAGAACAALLVDVPAAQQPTPQARSFRGSTSLVPVDVRVLDDLGRPVTDLTRADFRVFEDGVEQMIDLFEPVDLAPEPAVRSLDGPRVDTDATSAPENRRTFLILIGRGRHTGPVKAFPALDRFLREQLLPQDEVAVLAYNRASDFTNDHSSVAAIVDRYRWDHERIEALIEQNQNVILGVSRPEDMPPFVQRRIDAIFGRDQVALGEAGEPVRADAIAIAAGPEELSFDRYVSQAFANLVDVTNINTGLEYLRFVEGEKHLLVLTAGGLGLRDARDEDNLAALAADARVTLQLMHTAGMVGAPPPDGSSGLAPVPTAAQVFGQTFAVHGLRAIAEATGGQAWAFERGDEALAALDRSTRSRYLLGYEPTTGTPEDRYRRIRVEVSRPGLKVLYRRGYYASEAPRRTDFAEVRALGRVRQASGFAAEVRDFGVSLDATVALAANGTREVVAAVTIDPARFDFPVLERMRLGVVDIAVFVGNERQQVIAEAWHKREWTLSEDGFATLRAEPLEDIVRVPIRAEPHVVKVVVYERGSNLIGTAIVKLPIRNR